MSWILSLEQDAFIRDMFYSLFHDPCIFFLSIYSKRVRACDVCADTYTETHKDAENDNKDMDYVDAPPQMQYRELVGDEIEKYEKEEVEELEGGGQEEGETKGVKSDEVMIGKIFN